MKVEALTKLALNHDSQDYWVSLGLMERRQPMPVVMGLSRMHTDIGGIIIDQLNQEYGYIVKRELLALIAYGLTDRVTLHALGHHIPRVRERVNQPIFSSKSGVGYALGVRRAYLSERDAETLFVLRTYKGSKIHGEEVADRIFGDTSKKKIYSAYASVERLKQKPTHGITYTIEEDWHGYEFNDIREQAAA